MRTTLALDNELLTKAQALTGLKEKSALVREAFKALIERESARRWRASAALNSKWKPCRAGGPSPYDPGRYCVRWSTPMKKDELAALLGSSGQIPDLGPIEEHLSAIASKEDLPTSAIAMHSAD